MIEKNVNQKLLNEDTSAKILVDFIIENEMNLHLSGSNLYHKFPLYASSDDSTVIARVMIVSRQYGVLIFHCTEQTERTLDAANIQKLKDELGQINSFVYSELLKSKLLQINPTTLKIRVIPIFFLPFFSSDTGAFTKDWEGLSVITNTNDIEKNLDQLLLTAPLEDNTFKEILAILEGSKGIIRPRERARDVTTRNKGKVLDLIESEIANFDLDQKRAALFTLDKPQRIRGLAGTGKTIIHTMKAALIHLQHPEAEIMYTFYTRSLYSSIKYLITKFYSHFARKDPNWDKVHILHAWGGKNLPGVYYTTCVNNNIAPLSLHDARDISKGKDPFNEVCKALNTNKLSVAYDYSLLDEGQDFPEEFYRLCRQITKGNCLVWAYDECQNIFDIKIQDTKKTFGKDPDGNYYIDFSNLPPDSLQDMVLHRCYRNPRRILVCAFAIGLGIYNDKLIQIPENNEHWEDFGFQVLKGQSRIGEEMIITRPLENSPLLKNELLESPDVVRIQTFDSISEECEYIANSIISDIEQNLLPEDILVISLDDRNARQYFSLISSHLRTKGINVLNTLETPFYSTVFQVKDHVTLTTVYRAKGNEAGSVYIVGIDAPYLDKDSIRERNRFFTAITRAKGWVTLTGVGKFSKLFEREMESVLSNYPEFKFKMPDAASLKVFQRDLSSRQDLLNKMERELENIAEKSGISRDEILSTLMRKSKGNTPKQ